MGSQAKLSSAGGRLGLTADLARSNRILPDHANGVTTSVMLTALGGSILAKAGGNLCVYSIAALVFRWANMRFEVGAVF